jgi:hypothetical protein
MSARVEAVVFLLTGVGGVVAGAIVVATQEPPAVWLGSMATGVAAFVVGTAAADVMRR